MTMEHSEGGDSTAFETAAFIHDVLQKIERPVLVLGIGLPDDIKPDMVAELARTDDIVHLSRDSLQPIPDTQQTGLQLCRTSLHQRVRQNLLTGDSVLVEDDYASATRRRQAILLGHEAGAQVMGVFIQPPRHPKTRSARPHRPQPATSTEVRLSAADLQINPPSTREGFNRLLVIQPPNSKIA